MKMKKRRIIFIVIYLIGMSAIVGWICISNKIISKINNKEAIREVDFETERDFYLQDHIYYVAISNVDYIRYDGGMFDKLSVSGWAFCETEEDNSNRKVSFLLKSTDKCYEIIPYIAIRTDVPINVPVDLNRPDMKISSNTGYVRQFSLVDVMNGTYDLYLCCWENDTNHGMADLLYQLEKKEEDVSIFIWHARELDTLLGITQAEQTIGYLDKVAILDDYIVVYGWEYVPNKNCDTQKVFVELTDINGISKQYEARMLTRADVAKVYNNPYYAQSGYQSNIPLSDFSDGKYIVRILVENEGEVCQSKEYKMQIKEGVASKVE